MAQAWGFVETKRLTSSIFPTVSLVVACLISLALFFSSCSAEKKIIQLNDTIVVAKASIFYGDQEIKAQAMVTDAIGSLLQDETLDRLLKIENKGSADLVINLNSNRGAIKISEELPLVVKPGTSAQVTLTVMTPNAGSHEQKLEFVTNDPAFSSFELRFQFSVVPHFQLISSKGDTAATVANRGIDSFDSSLDGRLIAFETRATNLAEGSNECSQIYIKDMKDLSKLEVVSATPVGLGNGSSFKPKFSSNGRFLLFASTSTNLTDDPADSFPVITSSSSTICKANRFAQIFRKDLLTGEILLISRSLDGRGGDLGNSSLPLYVSDDGLSGFYESFSKTLVPGTNATDTKTEQIYYWSLDANSSISTVLVTSKDGAWAGRAAGIGTSEIAFINSQTKFVIFSARGFMNDLQTTLDYTLYKATLSNTGFDLVPITETLSSDFSHLQLSANGLFVGFSSSASQWGNSENQFYAAPIEAPIFEIVSENASSEKANQGALAMGISNDGSLALFLTRSSNLVGDMGPNAQLVLKNRLTGAMWILSSSDGSPTFVSDEVTIGGLAREGDWADMIASSIDFAGVIGAGKQLYRLNLFRGEYLRSL